MTGCLWNVPTDKGVLPTMGLECIVPVCLDSFHCECGDSKHLPSLWASGAPDGPLSGTALVDSTSGVSLARHWRIRHVLGDSTVALEALPALPRNCPLAFPSAGFTVCPFRCNKL